MSTHHKLLLTNEMVMQAKESPDPFVCLKLDMVKAFDSVEWVFIEKMMDKIRRKDNVYYKERVK